MINLPHWNLKLLPLLLIVLPLVMGWFFAWWIFQDKKIQQNIEKPLWTKHKHHLFAWFVPAIVYIVISVS